MPLLAAAVDLNRAPAAEWGRVGVDTAVVKARVLTSSKVRATDEAKATHEGRASEAVKVRPMDEAEVTDEAKARATDEAKARATDEAKAAEAADAAKRLCDAYRKPRAGNCPARGSNGIGTAPIVWNNVVLH